MRKSTLFLTGGAALLAASAPANLIVNGGFEAPAVSPGTAPLFAGGSTAITGWTVLGTEVDIVETTYAEPGQGVAAFNAHAGLQSLDLTGAGNTGMSNGVTQDIATVVGQTYRLSFWQGRAQSSTGSAAYSADSVVDLSIDGGARTSFVSTGINVGGVAWSLKTTTFVASGATTSVAFLNGTPGITAEAGVDDVSVEAVPEPASLAALALGAAMLRRRRK